ncbi:MAG: enoyl-CoA hydratase-related protein [Chloroflexota bacterium]|nr:enoyl-CoA hydratase-related protein [Dehalococcoidia bacterium]MDW8253462.1 enoyl-CoA hydratase-related protein [Chloroflexota bacterium]
MAILYETRGRIAYLTINRPEKRNAVDFETQRELDEAIATFDRDPDRWVLILTGAGDQAFSAGGDLNDWQGVWARGEVRRPALEPETWKPVIAAINGVAVGGGVERALRCDFRIAAEHARFRFSEASMSLIPPVGVLLLPRLIGYAHALEALALGDWITAADAYRIGLVHRVVPSGELLDAATAYAERLCANGPLAVRAIKEILWSTLSLPLEAAARLSHLAYQRLLATDDAKEGPRAWMERRPPRFQAR